MDPRENAKQFTRSIAMKHLPSGDYTGWFEELYQSAAGDADLIHWGTLAPNPLFVEWLQRESPVGAGKKAAIVGCGLGDDAEAIAKYGYDVTAFDVSPSAVEWCRRRFPQTCVNYSAADLFNPPTEWRNTFDLMVEAFTLQNFPETMRRTGLKTLAELIAPGGVLLIIAKGRDNDEPLDKIPWPLSRRELDFLKTLDLHEVQFENLDCPNDPPQRIFRATYCSAEKNNA